MTDGLRTRAEALFMGESHLVGGVGGQALRLIPELLAELDRVAAERDDAMAAAAKTGADLTRALLPLRAKDAEIERLRDLAGGEG